jgi:hypothetical protein
MQARSTLARSSRLDRRAGAPSLGACDRAELDEACFCPDSDASGCCALQKYLGFVLVIVFALPLEASLGVYSIFYLFVVVFGGIAWNLVFLRKGGVVHI